METKTFSIRSRKGIGVVPPVDPNNQDTSILTGSIDISKMDMYAEDDPRIFSLNGAFNVGNRGLVEFIEVFKNDVEYLHTIITATQEKSVPSPGKGSMIYFDGLIIAHSNEAEWNKFKSDHTNEAILDRIVKIEVPYCLELDEEMKIYQKIIKKSNFKAHIAPHTIEVAAMFAILSRLSPSTKVDPMTKLKIYNGEEIVEKGTTKRIDIMELREESGTYEGMKGISTRFIIKAIDNALSSSECDCINPLSIMESIIKSIKEMDIGADDKKKYLGFIIVKIEVPYCLELDEEMKIYQKIIKKSNFKAHIAPHTIEVAAMFAILSRLSPSTKVDPMTKLKIYNGEEIVEKGTTKRIDIMELREESGTYEGMKGISTRFIIKAIDNALSSSECDCINPLSIMESIIKSIKEMDIGADDKKKYLGFIQDTIRKEYNKMLEKEITKAFIHSFREQAESLFNNYIDNAEAFVNKSKIKDTSTGEELNPDEEFMRNIEEQIGVSESSSKGFRADVASYMFYLVRSGAKIDYTSYEPLKEAIEKKLIASVKDLSRIITKSRVRDKEQAEKYNAMVEEMKNNGYCMHCCDVILKYAANNLWKD